MQVGVSFGDSPLGRATKKVLFVNAYASTAPGIVAHNTKLYAATMRLTLLTLLTSATLVLAACRYTEPQPGSSLEELVDIGAVADTIALCQTADSTLLRLLGSPSRDGILHGDRIMSWLSEDAALTRYLAVLYDSAGTVVDVYWDIPTEVPWNPANQCIK